jgi:oligopeptidase B
MTLTPPVAEQRPHSFEHHGIKVEDPYHWLRDPGYPEVTDESVLDYLKAENAYFESVMGPNQPLIEDLFQEMKGRMKEDDRSVPTKNGNWLYWWAFEEGAQYRKWFRKPVAGGEERLIFDEAAEPRERIISVSAR